MSLRGTPYVYQGDEIGMTNVAHPVLIYAMSKPEMPGKPQNRGKDMDQFLNAVHWQSRNNAPLQWDATKQAGFTQGKPWFHQ